MKNTFKNLLCLSALATLPFAASAQTFSETFGTGTATSVAAYGGFNNPGLNWGGTADVRTTQSSSAAGGYANASGGSNIFLANNTGNPGTPTTLSLTANTSSLTFPVLTFGIWKQSITANGTPLVVEVRDVTAGGTFTAVAFPLLPNSVSGGGSTAVWRRTYVVSGLPVTSALNIRWTNTDAGSQYRIDDVKLKDSCLAVIQQSGLNAQCNGGVNSFTAYLNPFGGPVAGSSYAWSNVATTQVINSSITSLYNVTVTAANGCTASANNYAYSLVYPSPTVVAVGNTLVCAGFCTTLTAESRAADLFISEYVEGSSNNKYLEIYNGTGAPVSLVGYSLQLFSNGNVSASSTTSLSGTIPHGGVAVYRNSSAAIYSGTSTIAGAVNFNGNDAIALVKASGIVDMFGARGSDPIDSWNNGSSAVPGAHRTVNRTLRRKALVYNGVSITMINPFTGVTGAQDQFATLVSEWDVFGEDDITGLGAHTMGSCGSYSWTDGLTVTPSCSLPVCPSATASVNFTLTSTNINGCQASVTGQVSAEDTDADLIASSTNVCAVGCTAANTVTLMVVPITGTPASYLWSTGATTSSIVVCVTVTTVYQVTVTSTTGCVIVRQVTVFFCEDGGRKAATSSETTPSEAAPSINQASPVLNVYPNPFAEATVFEVNLIESGNVIIEIMDYTGKKVAEVNNSSLPAGTHKFDWNGNSNAGTSVSSGLYFARITSGNSVQNVKIQKLAK